MRFTPRSFPAFPCQFAFLSAFVAGCAGAPVTPPNESAAPAANGSVHAVTGSAEGILVNAYWVESEHGVVLVDSALTVSDARALREQIDAIGKPLLAVLITHGHPDHYNGVAAVIAGRGSVPVYATTEVSAVIRRDDAAKEAQWRPVFGAEWPAARAFPDHELDDAPASRTPTRTGRSIQSRGTSFSATWSCMACTLTCPTGTPRAGSTTWRG